MCRRPDSLGVWSVCKGGMGNVRATTVAVALSRLVPALIVTCVACRCVSSRCVVGGVSLRRRGEAARRRDSNERRRQAHRSRRQHCKGSSTVASCCCCCCFGCFVDGTPRWQGVELHDGTVIHANVVISNADPFRMRQMVGEQNLPVRVVSLFEFGTSCFSKVTISCSF